MFLFTSYTAFSFLEIGLVASPSSFPFQGKHDVRLTKRGEIQSEYEAKAHFKGENRKQSNSYFWALKKLEEHLFNCPIFTLFLYITYIYIYHFLLSIWFFLSLLFILAVKNYLAWDQ